MKKYENCLEKKDRTEMINKLGTFSFSRSGGTRRSECKQGRNKSFIKNKCEGFV